MVDVTPRFNAYLPPGLVRHFGEAPAVTAWSEFVAKSGRCFLSETCDEAAIADLERELKFFQDPSCVSVGRIIVATLFEKLKSKLSDQHAQETEKLKRELAMHKYFRPEVPVHIPSQIQQPISSSVKSAASDPVLEQEAELLLATYQTDTDQVINVRKHLQETNALISMLASKAVEQEETIGGVSQVASDAIDHVDSAERQLKKALEHNSSYRFYVVLWFLSLAFILVALDFVM